MLTRLSKFWIWNAIATVVTVGILNSRAIAAQTPITELPIVRSSVLQPDLRVPWSQPVRVIDLFEGESLAVFDQNYFTRSFRDTKRQLEVVSLWKPQSVSVLFAYSGQDCTTRSRRNFGLSVQHSFSSRRRLYGLRFGYDPFGSLYDDFPSSVCIVNSGIQKITGLSIKVGDRVFRLDNKNGQFPINAELAIALKNAPDQNAQLRAIADNGEVIDSAIGKGTVKAWRSIY